MNSDTSDTSTPGPRGGAPWTGLARGTRVVVRRRLTAAEAAAARSERRGAVWTDVIGFVLTVSDDGMTVRTDPHPGRGTSEDVRLPADLIVSAKPVPPRRARRT